MPVIEQKGHDCPNCQHYDGNREDQNTAVQTPYRVGWQGSAPALFFIEIFLFFHEAIIIGKNGITLG